MQQQVAPLMFANDLQRGAPIGGLCSGISQPLDYSMAMAMTSSAPNAQFDRQPNSNCSHDSGFQISALTPPSAPPEPIASCNTAGAVCVVSTSGAHHASSNCAPPSVSPPAPNLALTPPNSSLGSNASDTNSSGDSPLNQQTGFGAMPSAMHAMLDLMHRSPEASASPSNANAHAFNYGALQSLGSVNMSPPYSITGTRQSFSFSPQEASVPLQQQQQMYPIEELSLFTPNANAADQCAGPLPSAYEILSSAPKVQLRASQHTGAMSSSIPQASPWLLHPLELEQQLNSAVSYYATDGTPRRADAPYASTHWPLSQ